MEIDFTGITSVVTPSSVAGIIEGAFPLVATALLVSIGVGAIMWAVGMVRSVF